MPHPIVHVELATDDVPKAKAFYGKLFGWKMTDTPMAYTLFDAGQAPGGGIFKRPPEAPVGWSLYVGVGDAAAMLEKALKLGGTVIQPRTQISPEFGHFAVLKDPTGAVLCLHEPAPMPKKPRAKPKATAKARKPARRAKKR